MHAGELEDKQKWNAFVSQNGPRSGAFLHSFEWGTFREAIGERVHREGFYERGNIQMVALMIEKRLPFSLRYLFCPRGPVVEKSGNPQEVHAMIRKAGLESGALFFRFEPPVEGEQVDQGANVQQSIEIHPAHTLLLNLTQTEQEMLANMHQKTRYNIRLAERKGVAVEIGAKTAFHEVWDLFEKTATRGGFHLHSKSYYETLLEVLQTEECHAFLAVARYEGVIVAANVMVDFAGTRTYLHGASDHEHREAMAPYLLHFALIQDAKRHGLVAYDWWGVAPEEKKEHPWAGITRFKEGFGGERVVYPGTYDVILRPRLYALYTFVRTWVRNMRS